MAGKGREIRLSSDTGFLKIIAMASMLIDHMGAALFPGLRWMRIVGRIAFPIYAYCVAAGSIYTKNSLHYALRMLLMAVLVQPLYCLALNHMPGPFPWPLTLQGAVTWYVESLRVCNIMFSLLAGVLLIWSLREKKYIAAGLVTLLVWKFSAYLSYGWKGVALMVLFYALIDRPLSSLCWVGGFMLWWAAQSSGYWIGQQRVGIQIFALLALPFIYLPTRTGLRGPKWLFYLFYPAHLAGIYLVSRLGGF